jgi:NAD(P)H-dependent flavin oxidoreductase YrpB (nitropropane dioxygenase family)
MGKLRIEGYELRDVAVVQAPVAYTNHRGDVNPFVSICGRDNMYPVFVSPMASVTDQNNYMKWIENGLTPVVPRSVQKSDENPDGLSFEERMEIAKKTFVSVSLKEAREEVLRYIKHNLDYFNANDNTVFYICIDIAHGTLTELYDICRVLKDRFGKHVIIMTGNVANPKAYSFYADAGIDWMRASVGSGSRCTSACNVSVHYPMATLLDQLNEERKSYAHSHNGNAPTKIIADGGIGWFDDIQKSLALGADAVMCGKIFAECEEACAKIYYSRSLEAANRMKIYPLKPEDNERLVKKEKLKPFRDYYGMSTKRAQKQTGGSGTTTSEGIDRPVAVKYPVKKWVENMEAYLRSCMTYTNSHTINELRENAQVIILGGSGDAAYRK